MEIPPALVLLVTLFTNVQLEPVQIECAQGILEGETLPLRVSDKTYASFKGIPFAAPPVGSLRFKAPEPPVKWDGVRNAKSHGASCPHIDIFTLLVNEGNEDCLFLNVYTPEISPTNLLPVMVFIHGGGFKSGSGDSSTYGPEFLVNKGVVLVTFNYRLEALGFLCLGTEEVPGNAGLKDQVAALRWVKENINKFGGDPDRVTIFGQSAGGASVGYHLISPLSKGLFRRAILMSGTPLCDFTYSYQPVKRAFILGKLTGFNTDNAEKLLSHLQNNLTASQLIDTKSSLLTSEGIFANLIKYYNFVPVIEKDFGNNKGFITEDILNMIPNANTADVMMGYTNNETSTVIDAFNSTLMAVYDRYLEMFAPTPMFFNFKPDQNLECSEMIRKHYFGDAATIIPEIKSFVTYSSVASFLYCTLRFLNSLPIMKDNSRYLYKFSMSSNLNTYGNRGVKFGLNNAAGHLDDMNYIFTNSEIDVTKVGATQLELINTFCTLLTNFAKDGNPTPSNELGVTWEQYDTTKKAYLEIGNTLKTGTAPDENEMIFWRKLYKHFKWPFELTPKA